MVCSYKGILFGNKLLQSTDTCYKIEEPWKPYAKWKKTNKKYHLLCDSTWDVPKRQIYIERADYWLPGDGG